MRRCCRPRGSTGSRGGAFCAEDGFIEDCDGITNAFARAARGLGARVLYEEIVRLEPRGAGWRLHARHGTLDARAVVIAAGADSVSLVEPLGIRLPIAAERRRLVDTAPARPGLVPPLVASLERGFAIKQLINGVCYLGWLGERPAVDDLEFTERSLDSAVGRLPFPCGSPRPPRRGRHLRTRHPITGPFSATPAAMLSMSPRASVAMVSCWRRPSVI